MPIYHANQEKLQNIYELIINTAKEENIRYKNIDLNKFFSYFLFPDKDSTSDIFSLESNKLESQLKKCIQNQLLQNHETGFVTILCNEIFTHLSGNTPFYNKALNNLKSKFTHLISNYQYMHFNIDNSMSCNELFAIVLYEACFNIEYMNYLVTQHDNTLKSDQNEVSFDELTKALKDNMFLVICGYTGSGKTTFIHDYISRNLQDTAIYIEYRDNWFNDCIVTIPEYFWHQISNKRNYYFISFEQKIALLENKIIFIDHVQWSYKNSIKEYLYQYKIKGAVISNYCKFEYDVFYNIPCLPIEKIRKIALQYFSKNSEKLPDDDLKLIEQLITSNPFGYNLHIYKIIGKCYQSACSKNRKNKPWGTEFLNQLLYNMNNLNNIPKNSLSYSNSDKSLMAHITDYYKSIFTNEDWAKIGILILLNYQPLTYIHLTNFLLIDDNLISKMYGLGWITTTYNFQITINIPPVYFDIYMKAQNPESTFKYKIDCIHRISQVIQNPFLSRDANYTIILEKITLALINLWTTTEIKNIYSFSYQHLELTFYEKAITYLQNNGSIESANRLLSIKNLPEIDKAIFSKKQNQIKEINNYITYGYTQKDFNNKIKDLQNKKLDNPAKWFKIILSSGLNYILDSYHQLSNLQTNSKLSDYKMELKNILRILLEYIKDKENNSELNQTYYIRYFQIYGTFFLKLSPDDQDITQELIDSYGEIYTTDATDHFFFQLSMLYFDCIDKKINDWSIKWNTLLENYKKLSSSDVKTQCHLLVIMEYIYYYAQSYDLNNPDFQELLLLIKNNIPPKFFYDLFRNLINIIFNIVAEKNNTKLDLDR